MLTQALSSKGVRGGRILQHFIELDPQWVYGARWERPTRGGLRSSSKLVSTEHDSIAPARQPCRIPPRLHLVFDRKHC